MAKKILIVDDSAMMRSIIKNFINKSGIQVEFTDAVDGLDAIQKYQKDRPDLVFMDIMMPNLNGIESAKKIKELDSNAKIVMCTSIKEKEQEDESADIGVVDYITKPFNSEQIIEVMKKQLS